MCRCENCNKKFTYKQLFKAQFYFENIICSECFQEYSFKKSYRLILSILIALPIFFKMKLILSLNGYSILVYLIWICLVYSIMPFIYKLKRIDTK